MRPFGDGTGRAGFEVEVQPAGGVGVRGLLMGALLGASWALLGSLSGSLGTLLGFSKAVLRLPGPSRSSLERLVGRL